MAEVTVTGFPNVDAQLHLEGEHSAYVDFHEQETLLSIKKTCVAIPNAYLRPLSKLLSERADQVETTEVRDA